MEVKMLLIEDKDKVKFLTSLQELLDTLYAGRYEVNVQYATIKDRYTALVLYSVREDQNMDYREKYIELSYEYDELKAECRHLTDELKEVEEI